ncbi:MAG: helix-turn-helix domain-containing protein [Rhodobacteraceae bacterium]|nr:helix-turn-helix domain-containing protein [Paracoccaceae bacterium]
MDNVNQCIGARLRHRRWALKLTQNDLAQRVGLRFQQIQKYETGANRISAAKLLEFSQALDVEPWYFLEGLFDKQEEVKDGDNHVMDMITDKEAASLVHHFYKMPPELQESVLDLIKSISRDEAEISEITVNYDKSNAPSSRIN